MRRVRSASGRLDWFRCHVVAPAFSPTGQCAQSPFCTLSLLYSHTCLCAPLRRDPNGLVATLEFSACTGTGPPCSHTHSLSPNASGTGGYRGDAERCYLQGQAEARQPLARPPHQNSTADVRHREQQISVHILDGVFRVGKRAVEDCHVVLQPVCN